MIDLLHWGARDGERRAHNHMSDKTRAAADKLRAKYGFDTPPIDPEAIAEAANVRVVYVDFDADASDIVHGFFDNEDQKIYVNKKDEALEKIFTIAHELGHWALHQEYLASARYIPRMKNVSHPSKEEVEADEFAIDLLAPANLVAKVSKSATSEELESIFAVSKDVLRRAKANA
jgi:Zn-dependent peptidase ImmA (M78 family)